MSDKNPKKLGRYMNIVGVLLTAVITASLTYLAVTHLERFIVTELQSSTQAAVNALVDQLRKAHKEIVGKLAETHNSLHTQIAAVGAGELAAEDVDLSALSEIAQQLDDIVPDEVVEETVEVVEVEEVEDVDGVDEVDEAGEDNQLDLDTTDDVEEDCTLLGETTEVDETK